MMALLFLLFFILQCQLLLGVGKAYGWQFSGVLLLALFEFSNHATDALGLSW